MMDAVYLLQQEVTAAHDWLESTLGDVTPEQVHWRPEGGLPPLGAHYAHIITVEDFLINGVIKGGAPLLATTWEGKTGLSELPPGPVAWDEWGRTVRIDLPALRAYGRAVFASTDDYLATLTPVDLDRELDLTSLNAGTPLLGVFLGTIVISNVNWHSGEISLLKGLQGMRGYPL
jgi:hypothetical protein